MYQLPESYRTPLTLRAVIFIAACMQITWLAAADFTWEPAPVSGNWENPNNWSGPNLQIPDDNTDRAFILGDSPGVLDPYLTSNRTIGQLTIQNGGNVRNGDGTTNFSLTVQDNGGNNGTTSLQGIGSDLFIFQSPGVIDFDTDHLSIGNGSNLFIYDGARVQVDDSFVLHAGGSVSGNGILELAGVASSNDGALQAGGEGTLTVRSVGAGSLDLDGTAGNGILRAFHDSMLHVQAPLSDAVFNGTMTINSNAEIRIDEAWTLASTGGASLEFNGHVGAGAEPVATLSGADTTLSGIVNVNGGTAVLAARTHVTDTATFSISAGATIQFDAPTTFDDPNTIVNEFNTTWVVNDTVSIGLGAGNFNWDGLGQNGNVSGTTIVNPEGLLLIQVASLDEPGLDEIVSADITMNGGDIIIANADDRWEMAGTLTMHNPDNLTVPVLSGFGIGGGGIEVVISGNLNVTGSGSSGLAMRSVFGGSSHVNVAEGALLVVGGVGAGTNTVINGGDWTGAGSVSLDADLATVSAATVVNMPNGTFDIDGEWSGDTVALNAPLTLNVNSVERIAGEVVNDTLQINGNGRLDVRFSDPNQSYTIADELDLNGLGGGFASLHLAGSPVILAGTTDVSGNSQATARVSISGTMDIGAGGMFQFRGGSPADPNRLIGGTIHGPGELSAVTGTALRGFGAISADVDFDGTAELLADDGTLAINGALTDVGTIGTADADGVLQVAAAWNTNLADAVRLRGGRVQGGSITNDLAGGIDGFGEVAAVVNNNTRIDATDRTLILNNNGNDYDGSTETGVLHAAAGAVLEVRDNAAQSFDGTVQADTGATVFSNGFELNFQPASTLSLAQGRYRSSHDINMQGTITVAAGGESIVGAPNMRIFIGSNTNLAGDLHLANGRTNIDVGANFAGGGALINAEGSQLNLSDGLNLPVLVENRGSLDTGIDTAGQFTGLSLQQEATGTLQIDLEGTGLNDFDILTLTGQAQLDGQLRVDLIGGFHPELGDSFTILSAVGGVSGTFASIIAPILAPGLVMDVIYNPTNVRLQIGEQSLLECDLNGDGSADAADAGIMFGNWGNAGAGDCNGDGIVDAADAGQLFSEWTGDAVPATMIPEPSSGIPASLAILALIRCVGTCRKRFNRTTDGGWPANYVCAAAAELRVARIRNTGTRS